MDQHYACFHAHPQQKNKLLHLTRTDSTTGSPEDPT
jgi:hypothetical protein